MQVLRNKFRVAHLLDMSDKTPTFEMKKITMPKSDTSCDIKLISQETDRIMDI